MVFKYLLRGLIIAIAVYLLFKYLTPYPSLSIVILSGLTFCIPFPSTKQMITSIAILSTIGFIHYIHTVLLQYYNALMEFFVVVIVWSIIFWLSVSSRWSVLKRR